MIFFSKDKQTKKTAAQAMERVSSPDSDSAAKPSSAPAATSPDEEFALQTPEIPMSKLAQLLGIRELENNEAGSFFIHGDGPLDEAEAFWDSLNEKALALLRDIRLSEMVSDDEPEKQEGSEYSSDMRLETHLSNNQMTAYGCIIPPIGSGRKLSLDELKDVINNAGITYGINYDLIEELLRNGTVLRIFTIAEGKPARDGEDGKVIELFAREKEISLEADENDLVDYKNLNWLQPVHTGEIICQIIHPVPAEDGANVRGVILKGRTPKAPRLPIGKNIAENEDHTALIATCDGQLKFDGGSFHVEQMTKIDGDVDSSVGNMDVIGSVTINGCVTEGFTVKATGDIIVRGSVEGAELIADGNIQVLHGMNGSYKGKLSAGKNASAKYLENCFVTAGGTVKAESIVNSNVISGEKVIVTSGKGIILGSSVIGFAGIEAKTVGNEQHIATNLTIGTDPRLFGELQNLQKEVHELSRKSEENDKNIKFLQDQGMLEEKYQKILDKLKFDQKLFYINLSKKAKRITEIESELKSGEACQLVVSQLYPPVNVNIGNAKLTISDEHRMCRIFKENGEIIIGSK